MNVKDQLLLGLFLLLFSAQIAQAILMLWKWLHRPSVELFNDWLKKFRWLA